MAKQYKDLTPTQKKNLKQIFWRAGTMWGDFTMVKMEGNTYAYSMEGALEEAYGKDTPEFKEAFYRNCEFFNTHAATAGLVFGLSYAMELERGKNIDAIPGSMITNLKTSLQGPLAAIGDSIFFNCIRVISGGIGISLALQAYENVGIAILGCILFVAIYGGAFLITKWELLKLGFTLGTDVILDALDSGIIGNLSKAACAMGLVMVGSLTSSMISCSTILTIPMGAGTEMVVQDVFDGIMPGMLKMALLFLVMHLFKKQWKPIAVIGLILAIGIVGSFIGAF